MIIDASWVNRWVLFAMASAGPPGPITNNNLYLAPDEDDDGPTCKSGIIRMSMDDCYYHRIITSTSLSLRRESIVCKKKAMHLQKHVL